MISVEAIRVGWDNNVLRKPGDVFQIPGDLNEAGSVIALGTWMRVFDKTTKSPAHLQQLAGTFGRFVLD